MATTQSRKRNLRALGVLVKSNTLFLRDLVGQLIHKKGNLFSTNAHIIAHGCNCRGGFGSGVAGQIARLFPLARKSYIYKFRKEGWTLGEVQLVELHPDRIIANMATQDTFGGPGVHVDYEAVYDCFNTLLCFAQEANMDVAIPKIGAGLAGGDWAIIETIIRDLLVNYRVNVECYSLD